jgi:hypothetical protein
MFLEQDVEFAADELREIASRHYLEEELAQWMS